MWRNHWRKSRFRWESGEQPVDYFAASKEALAAHNPNITRSETTQRAYAAGRCPFRQAHHPSIAFKNHTTPPASGRINNRIGSPRLVGTPEGSNRNGCSADNPGWIPVRKTPNATIPANPMPRKPSPGGFFIISTKMGGDFIDLGWIFSKPPCAERSVRRRAKSAGSVGEIARRWRFVIRSNNRCPRSVASHSTGSSSAITTRPCHISSQPGAESRTASGILLPERISSTSSIGIVSRRDPKRMVSPPEEVI